MACPRYLPLLLFVAGLLYGPGAIRAQEVPADPAALVGLSLENLLARYGVPQSVHAARGTETWQDDVVFVYPLGDFYLYRDRVWQLGLMTAYGIKVGDPQGLVFLILGESLAATEDYVLCPLFGWNWPLTLRFNINGAGLISAIYIYRSDF